MTKKPLISPSSLTQPIDQKAIDQKFLNEFKKKYQHDAFCKNKLRNLRIAQKFLKHVLKPEALEVLDLNRLQIDPETFVDENLKRLYVDALYRIPIKNTNEIIVVFILIEIKTDNNKWTIFQLVKYVVRIWDRELQAMKKAAQKSDATDEDKRRFKTFLLPMVLPIIFHYGKNKFTAPTELIELIQTLQGTEEFVLNMKAVLCDTTELVSDEDLPQDLGLNILFMTLRSIFSEDVAAHLLKIHQKLQPTLHLEESQQEWHDALCYAATSAKHFKPEDYTKLIKQIQKKGDIPMSPSLVDELFAEGIEKGIAKGKAEGKAEIIIYILTRRLGSPSKLLRKKINSIHNIAKLDELADFALTCVSLDEFATALK